jgi:hypothetical protein
MPCLSARVLYLCSMWSFSRKRNNHVEIWIRASVDPVYCLIFCSISIRGWGHMWWFVFSRSHMRWLLMCLSILTHDLVYINQYIDLESLQTRACIDYGGRWFQDLWSRSLIWVSICRAREITTLAWNKIWNQIGAHRSCSLPFCSRWTVPTWRQIWPRVQEGVRWHTAIRQSDTAAGTQIHVPGTTVPYVHGTEHTMLDPKGTMRRGPRSWQVLAVPMDSSLNLPPSPLRHSPYLDMFLWLIWSGSFGDSPSPHVQVQYTERSATTVLPVHLTWNCETFLHHILLNRIHT